MNKFFKLNKKREAGFTIVEVLVTTLVFSIMATAVSAIYVQILNDERTAFLAQSIQENGQFVLEMMSREIRVSKILDTDQNPTGDAPNCTLDRLTIQHPVNGTVTYFVTPGGVLERIAGGVTSDISNSSVVFSRLNFCLVGSTPADDIQPRVAILATLQSSKGTNVMTVSLQTTVTSRDIDDEFIR